MPGWDLDTERPGGNKTVTGWNLDKGERPGGANKL